MSSEEKRRKSSAARGSLTKKATQGRAASAGRATGVSGTVTKAAPEPANLKAAQGSVELRVTGAAAEPARKLGDRAASAATGKKKAVAMPTEPAVESPQLASTGSCEEIEVRIRRRAHELWVQRGCEHGHATDDWLQAESEVTDSMLEAAGSRPGETPGVRARTEVK